MFRRHSWLLAALLTCAGSLTSAATPHSAGAGLIKIDLAARTANVVGALGDSSLPYVDSILVRPAHGGYGPICPGDSILVSFFGTFPTPCHSVKGIERIPVPIIDPGPWFAPDLVRVTVDNACCARCEPGPTPWQAHIALPGLPSDFYLLNLEMAEICCADSFPPGVLHQTTVPLSVLPPGECPNPSLPCMIEGYEGSDRRGCTATLVPGGTDDFNFLIRSPVALAALQGEFLFGDSGVHIANLEPIGPAAGMTLQWVKTPQGARFVLFAQEGAPIPASGPVDPGHPILRVTVEAGPDVHWSETRMYARDLLGSDAKGNGVFRCPIDIFIAARICVSKACDFNADGLSDVRDLVLMIRCLRDQACIDSVARQQDCNSDGFFTIDDVLCCARHILGGSCRDCPTDSVRVEPGVDVGLLPPTREGTLVRVPFRITSPHRVGAALLDIRYPRDRFTVKAIGEHAPGSTLTVFEDREGDVRVGLVPVAINVREDTEPRDYWVDLELKPGLEPGGVMQFTGGQFSGQDGVMIQVDLSDTPMPLGPIAGLVLSENQPEPFATETRFSVTLPREGPLELAVYDIAGRRLVELAKGVRPAGIHSFIWNGKDADGTQAPNGVYFYRAASGGEVLSRKMVLVRGN